MTQIVKEDIREPLQHKLLEQLRGLKGSERSLWTHNGLLPEEYVWEEGIPTDNIDEALLVGSLCYDGYHRLALDIDMPTELVKDNFDDEMLRIDCHVRPKAQHKFYQVLEEINLNAPGVGFVNLSGFYLRGNTQVVPSRTKGHFHLYNDTPLTWDNYKKLLEVLANAHIIEKNWYKMSLRHGLTRLRVEPYMRHILGIPTREKVELGAPPMSDYG